ncbi:LOW QUALITY PROTEIN: cyclic AMP-dependent transcription factor ATF-2 [Drosophila ficusphila]|uniref:LOW QUALITY PROTEIN: cyclic AMP-dependent transcription factor ATF-2 n=1 Tax=Drosophila ficusphila TaxID=30025 RepID=UPI0007E69796|nr:LOW QUALITY PROTEIN: cyclic AMP-dependent transcription factor ATF-2 [Drosophila ficusphila]
MDTSTDMEDLASVSFADFEPKSTEADISCYQSFQPQGKHDISLDLSLGQKSENLFVADQTPTPTRLIKNCDEVGLFEDLQHVNPFDIGFQRAAEQNVSGTPNRPEGPPLDGESLHTPQVYPLETSVSAVQPANPVSRSDSCGTVDVDQLLASTGDTAPAVCGAGPPPLQLIQPQVITWVLPAQSVPVPLAANDCPRGKSTGANRPYILPKPSAQGSGCVSRRPEPILVGSNPPPEPSSASLTPTSQLPIKERLKAILHNNNKRRHFSTPPKASKPKDRSRDEDCMERRRAAACRYRTKMRNEHKDLLKQNSQLQQENQELLERIARLEKELQQHKSHSLAGVVANQLQITPSSIHLLINVPSMLVPASASSSVADKK